MVFWYSKKQNSILLSTTEAKYIAAGNCCTQLLSMKQILESYGIFQDILMVYCDNSSVINISKNSIQHFKTKYIEICPHFIRELVENKNIVIKHITTDKQLTDIFTKAFDASCFVSLMKVLGICIL